VKVQPTPRIETARLCVRPAAETDVQSVAEFFRSNREFLAPWEPVRSAEFYTEQYWAQQLGRNRMEQQAGLGLRTFLFAGEGRDRVVGTANLNQLIRGVFHSCFLGYSLAEREQGKGLMAEALIGLLSHAFSELRLHRIAANYMPRNERSGLLLRKLGFVVEGYARDYLQIAGKWEDHVLTALLNPDWRPAPG
jgi:ribosomal-protein-alanine N-acetyltransferase